VFVEYVMLADVNDSHAQAVQLTRVLDPRVYKVNLIPFNPTVRGSRPPRGRPSRPSGGSWRGGASASPFG
jgi:adenine C2-methylase RlmN of 23S rRNA A2503 and tRNA A37